MTAREKRELTKRGLLNNYLNTLGETLAQSQKLSDKIRKEHIDSQAMALAKNIPMMIEEAKKFYDEWIQLENKENALA